MLIIWPFQLSELCKPEVDYEKERRQHTPLSESSSIGEWSWFNSLDTETNLWSRMQWLDGRAELTIGQTGQMPGASRLNIKTLLYWIFMFRAFW